MMLALYVLFWGLCLSNGFFPGENVFKVSQEQPTGTSSAKMLEASMKQWEQQGDSLSGHIQMTLAELEEDEPETSTKDVVEERMANLTHQISHALAKIKVLENLATNEASMNATVAILTDRLDQALAKISESESRTEKKVSSLKTQLLDVVSDMSQMKTTVEHISSEVKRIKSTKQEKSTTTEGVSCPLYKGYHQLSKSMCIRHSGTNDKQSWYDCQSACKRQGADLVTFYSQQEQDLLMKFLNGQGKAAFDKDYGILRSWVGMSKINGNFSWVSDSVYPGKWGRNQPKNMSVLKCVSLVYDGLNDGVCGARHRYICQIKV